jgi:hypothetical protein
VAIRTKVSAFFSVTSSECCDGTLEYTMTTSRLHTIFDSFELINTDTELPLGHVEVETVLLPRIRS